MFRFSVNPVLDQKAKKWQIFNQQSGANPHARSVGLKIDPFFLLKG